MIFSTHTAETPLCHIEIDPDCWPLQLDAV